MGADILVGDAVRKEGTSQPTMTVYDFENHRRIALCNWLVGHQMHKTRLPIQALVKVPR